MNVIHLKDPWAMNAYAFWGGSDVSGRSGTGGGNIGTGLDLRPPAAPRELIVTVVGDFTIKATFRDFGTAKDVASPHPVFVQRWEMRICPIEAGGTPTHGPEWKRQVLAKSRGVASVMSGGRGELVNITVTDDTLQDCYVQIVGYSYDNAIGVPSEPYPIYANGTFPSGPLDDVFFQAATPTLFTDEYGGLWVDMNVEYNAPMDLGRFYGVSLYAVGYLGSTDLQELGNILRYTKARGGQKVEYEEPRMACDDGTNPVTLYFVSVDREGRRRLDPLAAPSYFLANGIFAV